MTRVKIELPATFDFSTDLRLRFRDINAGNHLAHDAVLSLAEEARFLFLEHLGYPHLNIDGCGYVAADAAIVYKSQAFFGEVIRVEVAVRNFASKSCDFLYRLSNRETGQEVARAKTGVVFFDYGNQKPVRVPDGFRARFERGG
ncbi:MAG: Thioesterase superfamily protein [Syntrophus sp. PtaU1.Bin005]|jgi:YbgC/YbaW family acyl-CoA thioester hydrolase|uniref:acyl-CoA thioesterase n=1 Tax=Syntrophus buswellii TaxID=43774 RepID=UPI0009D32FB8|nr:MAG: Thioesterase superfamily protein [Syntrophus sp. PtaB.Bin138]OPY80827.1 MAG: Thioesterase superfamily protein [Syntrophus sp. PtaU1.Bin005]